MRIGTGTVFLAVLILAGGLFAQTDDIEAKVKALKKELTLGAVVKSDFRDDKDQKFERYKLTTEQEKDDPFLGAVRFTVEMTDKAGQVICGQKVQPQAKHPAEYAGRDEWTFDVPHGALDKPKITAYALEYGWETNKVFTPVEQEFYKVESAEEILARNKDSKQKLTIKGSSKAFRMDSGD